MDAFPGAIQNYFYVFVKNMYIQETVTKQVPGVQLLTVVSA